MSNPDSFIDEVNEEVRRDRMNRLMRRYGWVAVLAVFAVVGIAAGFEWRKAQSEAAAQAFGDALLSAAGTESAIASAAEIENIPAEGLAATLRDFISAARLADSDPGRASGLLGTISEDPEVPAIYRDLATLKLAMLDGAPLLSDEKLQRLAPLTAPGAPFRLTALEATALLHIERGDRSAALDVLQTVASDAAAPPAMRSRAQELIVALGGLPDEA